MPRKNSHITVTDQFCGAGGSSQGVRRLSQRYGGGVQVKLALNHWKLAIETHNTNFPETLHDCTDVSACDPRRYPSTDILITSPECTTHSPAGGNNHKALKKQMDLFETGAIDPATERSRATMWDVCRFAEYHKYNAIIVENVVEAKTRWALFDVWLQAMHTLGYNHRCVYLNSMHAHPTPQSRDRMYVVFWRKGNKAPMLDYMPLAYCPKCSRDVHAIQTWKRSDKQYGKYKQQYVYCCGSCTTVVDPYYYASFNCIDWSDIGERIGDKPLKHYKDAYKGEHMLPLAPNTLTRIDNGIEKHGGNPIVVHRAYGKEARNVWRSVTEAFFTQATSESQALINPPFIVNNQHQTGIDFRVKSSGETLPTIPTAHGFRLVTPPFLIKTEQGSVLNNNRSITDTLQTQLCWQTSALVAPPFIVEQKGFSTTPSITSALSTETTKQYQGLVTNEAWNSFIAAYNNGSHVTKHISNELPTQPTGERLSLVSYQQPNINDCYYRMLKPQEIKLGMAFDQDYIVLGSAKDKVRQLGNAVTPPAMEWLVQQVIESLN